ncbi:MAG: hypothetical protein PHT35_00540 [Bacteroidales bacterium]|nr:hypothetical protein [Bacteroidales bacterium]MDD3521579.1 hypothetical protein [Bacteroidales bacterium]MDD4029903.1 hypothetical protein [Bacteroidales bacterium]MDD4435205.1 hypothetical protein [Bacteroidales bacterium]
MKVFSVLAVWLLVAFTALHAQGVFLAIDDTRPYTELYMFPAYMSGTIQFEDGTAFTGQLNILLASSTLCFLDEEGQPDLFTDKSQVSAVLIGRNYFIPLLDHYIQILDTDGSVMFGIEQYLELEAEKRYGAFGREEKSSNVPIEKRNLRSEGFNVETGGRKLAAESTPYTVHQNAYLIRNKKAYALNRKNFKRFFPAKKALIELYEQDNTVDYSNPDQTLMLFKFLTACR